MTLEIQKKLLGKCVDIWQALKNSEEKTTEKLILDLEKYILKNIPGPIKPVKDNKDRAARANRAVKVYQGAQHNDDPHATDLLCDILHLIHRRKNEISVNTALWRAIDNFKEELCECGDGLDPNTHMKLNAAQIALR